MASFTDQMVAFNPYVQEVPVDDYVRVGMIKQDQYRQGVEKVQSYIDSVAGIEAVKSEQKDYIKQRVGQLQGEVSNVLSADFSNQQLVSSVGSMTSKMQSDPIIQNTIASTATYKQGVARMKEAQEKGQSAPSNEWDFQNKVQKWLGDKDVSSRFNGEYILHTDTDKKVLAVIKELKPDSKLEDIPYSRGAGGQILLDKDGLPSIDYAMMQKSMEGVSPEKIHAAIKASLDPNDIRQLQIDGAYTYRGYDKQGLKGLTDQSYTYRLDQINGAIKGLMVDRQTNTSDQNHIKQVDAEIQRLKDRAHQYQESYKQDVGSLDKDPDGFKSQLYTDNWLSKFDEGFAWAKNSLTYKNNPFFDAAEKQRENNIKFEEFKINKELGFAKLGIEQAKLEMEREKLEIEWAKIGKKKGGAGGQPLNLTGADIREPIQQADLQRINSTSFINETDQMSKDIDAQKMSLLAQARPDLVHVVRDAEGKNPHYEYNVEGKDPNTVKSEAEATVLKLKDSYSKGEQVDDGAKTYFDNLGNTTLKVENRKAALTKLQGEADKNWNIKPALDRVSPLNVTSSSGTNYTITAEKMMQFNEKLNDILVMPKSMGTGAPGQVSYDSDKAKELLTTPEDKFLYSIFTKNPNKLTEADKGILRKLQEVNARVNTPNRNIIAGRTNYLNNATRDIVGATQPVSFPIESGKIEDKSRVRAVVGDLLNSTVAAGKDNTNPNYSEKRVGKMLDDEKNTTYSLVAKGGDRYALRLTNASITTDPVEMDVTKVQAQDLFGAGQFLDDFQAIREALQLSKGSGKVTTDVQGKGRESAFTLNNGNINNYGVKYHVEEPLKNGGLMARLYIYDKKEKAWTEKTANLGQLLDEAQVTRMLSLLTDEQIDNLLGKK